MYLRLEVARRPGALAEVAVPARCHCVAAYGPAIASPRLHVVDVRRFTGDSPSIVETPTLGSLLGDASHPGRELSRPCRCFPPPS